jgi:hypothetical protein
VERLAKTNVQGPNDGINVAEGLADPLPVWRWLATESPLRALHERIIKLRFS